MTPGGPAKSVVVLDYGSGNVHSAVKALELAGADPERVEGPVCGRVADQFATDQFSVRRTAGEQWSQLIVRVYVDGEPMAPQIDYGLAFTL